MLQQNEAVSNLAPLQYAFLQVLQNQHSIWNRKGYFCFEGHFFKSYKITIPAVEFEHFQNKFLNEFDDSTALASVNKNHYE